MAKRRRPEKAPNGLIYLIRHSETDIHKIGITLDWDRRARELEVGRKANPVAVVRVLTPHRLEKSLHEQFSARRVPQSEWFHLDADQVEHVLRQLREAEAVYKNWLQSLQAPKHPARREPQPYRMVSPPNRLTPSSMRQVANGSANPTIATPPQPKGKATPSRITPTSTPISWNSAFVLGGIISLCFPVIGLIMASNGVTSSVGKSLLIGIVAQSALIAYWVKKNNG